MTNQKQCVSPSQPATSSKRNDPQSFPLPDWLGPVLDRKLIDIGDFASNLPPVLFPPLDDSELYSLHLLIQNESRLRMSASAQRNDVNSIERNESQLSSVVAIEQQGQPCQPVPDWTPRFPNLSELVLVKNSGSSPSKKEVSVNTSQVTEGKRFGKGLIPDKGIQCTDGEQDSNNIEHDASSSTNLPPARNLLPVLVNVAVYDAEAPTKSAELLFSGNSALVDLIDRIPCTARAALPKTSTAMRSTAVIFIEGSLYVDHRFDVCDYETPIRDFLAARAKAVHVVQLSEQIILFSDLKIRLGRPYVFLHNGDCEHIFLFTDVFHDYSVSGNNSSDKLIHNDLWRRSPRVTACDVCRARMAVKFTIKDPWVDTIPFHYCETCFTDAHYTREGKLFSQSEQLVVYDHPETL